MKDKQTKIMNIGASSLVLILIVMVLATFGILSLSGARNDWNLAQKNAASVRNYYEAANTAEEFLQSTDKKLISVMKKETDPEQCKKDTAVALKEYYDPESGTVSTDIAMENGLSLRVSAAIECDPDIRYTLESYQVYMKDDLEIDQKRPVWQRN